MNKDGKKTNTNNNHIPNSSNICDIIGNNNLITQNIINKTDHKNHFLQTKNKETNQNNIELTEIKNQNLKTQNPNNDYVGNTIIENFSPPYFINGLNNNKLSSITVREDYDNFVLLQKKYLEEKEQNQEIEEEKRLQAFKEESSKKLSKNLVGFAEKKIIKILQLLDFMICFFVLSDVSLSIYTNTRFTSDEEDLNNRILKERFYTDNQIEDLRICIMIIVFAMEVLLMIKYYLKLKILRSNLFASYKDSIFSTGLYKIMFLEMILLAVFTPPSINGYFSGKMLFGFFTYSSDSFILLIKMIKLYYLMIIYSHISVWTSDRAREIAKDNKSSIGANFAFKAMLKCTPFLSIGILLFFSLITFSFMLRIFEYGFSQDASNKFIAGGKAIENAAFKSYADIFWVVIITMMTVGYGDLFPKTHMGRVIAFLSSIMGMIILSLLIVTLSNIVELASNEKKAYNEIKKVDDISNLNLYSKNLIKSIFKLKLIKQDKNLNRKEK